MREDINNWKKTKKEYETWLGNLSVNSSHAASFPFPGRRILLFYPKLWNDSTGWFGT